MVTLLRWAAICFLLLACISSPHQVHADGGYWFDGLKSNEHQRGLKEPEKVEGEKITPVMVTHFADIARALASLAALRLNMPSWAVHEMLMLVPYAESRVLPLVLPQPDSKSSPWPIRVIAEHEVLGVTYEELTNQPDFHTFYFKYKLQMALKLFVAHHVATDFYLILDSDVIMIRPIESIRWFLPEPGTARYEPEPRHIHEIWWNQTETYLKLEGCLSKDPNSATFGVTPALMSTFIARETTKHMKNVLGHEVKDWLPGLLSNYKPFWTEYCSYRLVACKLDKFYWYHRAQLPDTPRLYSGCWNVESTHNSTIRSPDGAIFLVVQSNTKVPVRKIVLDLADVYKW